jgi:hypothetical protein
MTITGDVLKDVPIREINLTELHKRMLEGVDPLKAKPATTTASTKSASEDDLSFISRCKKEGKTREQAEIAWLSTHQRAKLERGDYRIRTLDKVYGSVVTTVVAPLARERMSAVAAERLEWLWEGRFPLKMTLTLVGQGGVGKSMLTEMIAARVSTGRDYPDGAKNTLPVADIIMMNNEDSPSRSIRPRLEAAGANLDNIIRIKLEDKTFSADTDMPSLEETLKAEPNVRLVVIDPIADLSGDVNPYSANEVRQKILNPLNKLAVIYNVCIIICLHTNKKEGLTAINRVDGTQAWISGVRGSWLVQPCDEDALTEGETGFVLQFNKSNCFPRKKGFKGKIVSATFKDSLGNEGQTAKMFWTGETDKTAQETFDAATDPNERKCRRIVNWLKEFLCDDCKPATEVFAAAKELGFTDDQVKYASRKIKIVKTRDHDIGRSMWSLPVCAGGENTEKDGREEALGW